MKKFRLRTDKKPVVLTSRLGSSQPVDVYIVGYDSDSPKTEYFTRHILLNGTEKVEFNCPQTPNVLTVIAWGEKKFSMETPRKKKLQRSLNFTGPMKSADMKFIEKFARKCGRLLPRRTYIHNGASFKIQLLPVILNDNGTEHTTPARIHVTLPIIQVSKKHFDKMSIPQRVAILAHEYSHNFVNIDKDSEIEADTNMVDIYDGLGYGRLEALYAFSNIMPDNDTNYRRLQNIYNNL